MKIVGCALASVFFLLSSASAAPLRAAGVVRAQDEVVVKSEASGILWNIRVEEGQQVREGQLLVELKNNRQKIGVELARANLLKAQSSLVASKVAYENAKKEWARVSIAGDALPRKELEDKEDETLRLQALLQVQEGEIEQAKAELKLRENELTETQLLAPFSAVVTQIFIHKGDAVRPLETPVLELVALDRLYVELVLPVEVLPRVRVNQRVRVQTEREILGRAGVLEGRVSHINPKVDASSRTFFVKVIFSDPQGKVHPGMLGEVSFPESNP
ncbi:MAG: efflux RND transporter periplasmic adaptor subunit [Candidatus Tectomicrobia bacterium]|uniref:Efflux RND transporter periplasmic adaptor subunit n=1 Tax=Tectimicrobiota bacterium TaxID=2528274 RepID=A0A932M0B5_UNCTE|nr:efflux RND transporter periplasmic adaptor subunit [Candidatus Tectomicrobia bacterium]